MSTVYILNNNFGILLGVYRTRNNAEIAAKKYINDLDFGSGMDNVCVYKVTSDLVDKIPGNHFEMIFKIMNE